MDLNKMVMDSMAKLEKDGTVQEIIEKHIKKTMDSVAEDLYGHWSDFSKDLKKEAKQALKINFDDLNLPTYNHLIMQVIKAKMEEAVHVEGVKQIEQQIESLLIDPKSEYKLSELVKELSKEIEDLNEIGYDECYEMTLHVEDSTYGSYWIGMDAREDISEYDCKYRLLVSDEGKVHSVKIAEAEYGTRQATKDFDVKAVLNGLRGLEETLFKLYASGAKLIIDEDHCNTEISNPEYD